ncbi:MAG: DMT family transporter [Acidobacteriota bacterium]
MPIAHAGELAALATASCWVATALAFEAAGRRIGSLTVNLLRLLIAIALGALAAWWLRGQVLPLDATAHAWGWLALSGLVGFTFGDLCLFRAFVVLGPRLSTLMMALAPPLTVVVGWSVLGETMSGRDLLGMTLTVVGVAWAILDRGAATPAAKEAPRTTLWGVALGFGGALGQAVGLVLSKLGMGDYDPFAATQIRVLAGTVGYVVLFTLLRRWRQVGRSLGDRRALAFTSVGAFFGPFLGVSLSLVAIRYTTTGVAASLMATTPILIIPVVVLLGRERVRLGGWLGAVVAVAGVVLLFG